MICVKSLNAYSQQITLNERGDTLICFNKDRAKFLLKNYYQLQQCKESDSINTVLVKLYKNVVSEQKEYIYTQHNLILKQDTFISFQKQSIDNLVKVIEDQNKDIAKQKTKTFVTAVAGLSGFIFMTYMWFNQIIKN